MKKGISIIFMCFLCSLLYGQSYSDINSLMRKALVYYQKDSKGFYQKSENVNMQMVSDIEENYAYDKKSQELYVMTSYGNCVITVTENYAKIFKKSKNIPQLKGEELNAAIERINKRLEEKFYKLNQQWQKHLEDSIAKAKADSIAQAREDSLRLVMIARQKENYRNAHNWRMVPISRQKLSCSLCDKKVFSEDSIFCLGYKNDTLYYITREELALGISYLKIHPINVPNILKSDKAFSYHVEVFEDSLQSKIHLVDDPNAFNYVSLSDAVDDVVKKAPYGFFGDWGWNDEYGIVTFHFEYTNTNKATIKYIDVYWTITNDVGDARCRGHFKGTGPVSQWESASWNWDYSSYFVAGDATNMDITKVIITYMNGSQKILSKSMLHFD